MFSLKNTNSYQNASDEVAGVHADQCHQQGVEGVPHVLPENMDTTLNSILKFLQCELVESFLIKPCSNK